LSISDQDANRLRRRRAELQERIAVAEAELQDVTKIEAALLAAVEIVRTSAPVEPKT
jgi:hypothetical protein